MTRKGIHLWVQQYIIRNNLIDFYIQSYLFLFSVYRLCAIQALVLGHQGIVGHEILLVAWVPYYTKHWSVTPVSSVPPLSQVILQEGQIIGWRFVNGLMSSSTFFLVRRIHSFTKENGLWFWETHRSRKENTVGIRVMPKEHAIPNKLSRAQKWT